MKETSEISSVKKGEIRLKKSGKFCGIVLHDYEIILIEHTYIHKIMRATSVHSLLSFLSKRNMRPVTISNRLSKLVNSGVLARLEEKISDMSGNFVRYYYKLGIRGYSLLEAIGYLSENQATKQVKYNQAIKLPSFHTKAASVICNEIAIKCLNDVFTAETLMSRGANHYEFGTYAEVSKEMKGIIIPDYVFELDNVYVAIEIDTGHQRSHIIKSKYERYKKKAFSLKETEKSIMVVFVVVDDSVASEASSERDKRIASLKNMFPPFNEWGKNLQFYAVQATNAPRLIVNLLSKRAPAEKESRQFMCEDWIDSVVAIEQGRITAERYSPSEFTNKRAEHVNADVMTKFTEAGRYPKSFGLLYMQEGSVMSYQIYRANLLRMQNYNDNAWKIHDIHRYSLMLIYEDMVNVKNDVISSQIPELSHVFMTDSDTWFRKQLNQSNEFIVPEIYEMVSPFKKEKRKDFL